MLRSFRHLKWSEFSMRPASPALCSWRVPCPPVRELSPSSQSPPQRSDFLPCSASCLPLSTCVPQEQSPGLEDSCGAVFFETAARASEAQ